MTRENSTMKGHLWGTLNIEQPRRPCRRENITALSPLTASDLFLSLITKGTLESQRQTWTICISILHAKPCPHFSRDSECDFGKGSKYAIYITHVDTISDRILGCRAAFEIAATSHSKSYPHVYFTEDAISDMLFLIHFWPRRGYLLPPPGPLL